MYRYILRRLVASIPVIALVGIITFSLMHVAPGDPASVIAGTDATPQQVAEMRHTMGLDRPILVQFGTWFAKVFQGDLGKSLFTGHSVLRLMAPRLEPSLSLAGLGLVLAILLGVPMGILAAWRSNTWLDRAVMVFAVLGFSIPVFWLGFNFIWLFAVKIRWFPVVGYTPFSNGIVPFLHSLTLPIITVAVAWMALIARMTRSSMLEVLREDYVRTARAKGLAERVVLIRHALRAGSIPVVTIIGVVFATAITGVVITETVYSIPGLGRLIVDSVIKADYPIIQGMIMLFALSYVLMNLLVDVAYAYLDPRIRY